PGIPEACGDDPSTGPLRRILRPAGARCSAGRQVFPLLVPVTHVAASLPSDDAGTAVPSHVSDVQPTHSAVPLTRLDAEVPGRSAVCGWAGWADPCGSGSRTGRVCRGA